MRMMIKGCKRELHAGPHTQNLEPLRTSLVDFKMHITEEKALHLIS